MAKQQQKKLIAQHLTRVDKNGNPQRKEFTVTAWNNVPLRHYSSREDGIVKQEKNGWVLTGESTGTKAPEPLKKPEPAPVAIQTPRPQPQRPTPLQEAEKV